VVIESTAEDGRSHPKVGAVVVKDGRVLATAYRGEFPGDSGTKRKPWVKKSPVEIILEQVEKQDEKVAAMRKELAKEEGELKKMQDATKLLQAK
jgi:deoxycytidylate deaminase